MRRDAAASERYRTVEHGCGSSVGLYVAPNRLRVERDCPQAMCFLSQPHDRLLFLRDTPSSTRAAFCVFQLYRQFVDHLLEFGDSFRFPAAVPPISSTCGAAVRNCACRPLTICAVNSYFRHTSVTVFPPFSSASTTRLLNLLVSFRLVRTCHPLHEHRIFHLALCPI